MTTKKRPVPKEGQKPSGKGFRSIAELERTYFPNFDRERAAKRGGNLDAGTGFASTFLETIRTELSKHDA